MEHNFHYGFWPLSISNSYVIDVHDGKQLHRLRNDLANPSIIPSTTSSRNISSSAWKQHESIAQPQILSLFFPVQRNNFIIACIFYWIGLELPIWKKRTRHWKFHTTTFCVCVVGQAFCLTIVLCVSFEETQMAFRIK